MGARRRCPVGPLSNSKEDDLPGAPLIIERISESLISEVVTTDPLGNNADDCSSSGGSCHDDSGEEEENVLVNASTIKDMTEGEMWHELEKELQRDDDVEAIVQVKEEAAAAKEITEEEKVLVDAVESKNPVSSLDVSESPRFCPPGRIMHIVSMPLSDTSGSGDDDPVDEHVGIYKTSRDLYSKLRLSRTMINDHYMPMYKRMMERLIRELERDEACSCT
ncbi:lipase class 3 family protein [Actinidia rufa]|uniref:Lipase class 3 family protein n=1 Tax=Actinidia rufa TaxID=165716 RepID=A0A7J0GT63_9ERIC|nr:lipase class 3 family protein [Actinidia rufa]